MGNYPENVKLRIFRFPVVGILEYYGKRTDHINEMYYSPFREESSPSFHINIKAGGHYWYDFGAGTDRGGLAVDLVALLENCTRREAVDIIASIGGDCTCQCHQGRTYFKSFPSRSKQDSSVVIDRICNTFRMRRLIEYAEKQRCIPSALMGKYCQEIHLHFRGREDRQHMAIGFRNNAGGYSYRNSFIKGCSISSHTTVGNSGGFQEEATSDAVSVFEGFFDFLSWMAITGRDEPGMDVCVLNSVNNLDKAIPYIGQHRRIDAFFDNDDAGRAATKRLEERFGHNVVQDMAHTYRGYKDVNESLTLRNGNKLQLNF